MESARYICQVKHRRTCSLAELEGLAVEMYGLGRQRGKVGLVCVKRRAGCGNGTPRLLVMTERAFQALVAEAGIMEVTLTLPARWDEIKARLVVAALDHTGGNVSATARLVGIPRRSLVRWLRNCRVRADIRRGSGIQAPGKAFLPYYGPDNGD